MKLEGTFECTIIIAIIDVNVRDEKHMENPRVLSAGAAADETLEPYGAKGEKGSARPARRGKKNMKKYAYKNTY